MMSLGDEVNDLEQHMVGKLTDATCQIDKERRPVLALVGNIRKLGNRELFLPQQASGESKTEEEFLNDVEPEVDPVRAAKQRMVIKTFDCRVVELQIEPT